MITLSGLTKQYGEATAVHDLTLEITPGRVTGFLGPNGAGKSTTMRQRAGEFSLGSEELVVSGVTTEHVGDLAHSLGIRLHELRTQEASLEQAYMELTAASVQYSAGPDQAPARAVS